MEPAKLHKGCLEPSGFGTLWPRGFLEPSGRAPEEKGTMSEILGKLTLGTPGALSEPLGPSGTLWEPLGPSGTLWEPLGPSGTLWEPLGPSGTPGTLWNPLTFLLHPPLDLHGNVTE